MKKIKVRNYFSNKVDELEIPARNVEPIAKALKKKFELEEREKKFASAREVLTILASGTMLAASLVMPGLPRGFKSFIESEDYDTKEWKKFNPVYLARTIKRLEEQKLVEILEEENWQVVKITERGRKRILRYALEELQLTKPESWNGNWLRNVMRDFLTKLGFYRFHESLYIHAYPCEEEIDFLREYLGAGEYVKVLVVNKIENDKAFREYFGI